MIEGVYYFGDQLRWNLGWPNPNVAGAFMAMLLAFAFSLSFSLRWESRGARIVKGVLYVSELVLGVLLCKTYSRGALIALVAGALLFYGVRCLHSPFKTVCRAAVPRICVLAILLASTGFWSRVTPSYVQADASVGNRWTLWKGGMEMISHQPWSGWGAGESGRQFMHWFQPVEERAAVAGMVNSYLHIGVERGLPVLFGWLALGSFFGTLPLIATVLDRQPETCRIRKALVTSAGSVMAVFLVANVFSTLWIFPRLWIPVVAACGLMAGGFVSGFRREIRRNLWGAAGASLLLSLFVLSAVYGTGRMLREQNPLRLQVQGAFLRLPGSSDEDSLSPPLYIVPSAEVFGEDWGKEVRRLDSSMPERKWSLVVAWKDVPENEKRPPVFSHTMDMVTSILPPPQRHVPSAVRNLLILHPQEPPPASLRFSPERVRVLLPSLDMTGTAGLWRRAAKQRGWTVANSGAFTQDIRTVWPDGVLEYIEEE